MTELHDRCATWWAEEGDVLLEPMNQGSMAVKERLIVTFAQALGSQGVIGEFVLTGLVAQWWVDHMEEVQALAAGGPRRVVEGWAASVAALFPCTAHPRRTQIEQSRDGLAGCSRAPADCCPPTRFPRRAAGGR